MWESKERGKHIAERHMCSWHCPAPAFAESWLWFPNLLEWWGLGTCCVGGGVILEAIVTWVRVIFSTWVGISLIKLVVALVLLVIWLRLGILSIHEWSTWIQSSVHAWAKITPALSLGSVDRKYLCSWRIVNLNEYWHGLLVLERVSPLFWPNVRNIKDVFRQWEKKGLVWLTETVEQERRCFEQGYYG